MALEILPKTPSHFTQTLGSKALVLKFSTHQNCMEGLLKPRLLAPQNASPSRISNSVCLRCNLIIFIFDKLPGDTDYH